MFGRELTPTQQIDKSQKKINKILKKRDKLDKKRAINPFGDDYDTKRKRLNRKIANEIEKKDTAKLQLKHPPKKQTSVNATVNFTKIENKASAEAHLHIGGKKVK